MPNKKFHLCLLGINHKTAPVEVRERCALPLFEQSVWPVPKGDGLDESLVLSTCNRVEILAAGRGTNLAELALQAWCRACAARPEDLRPHLYTYQENEAVAHLFKVASSLDSLVVGEPQILGQLKQAFRQAVEAGQTGSILNRLLHKSFSVAKRVRTETAVASSAVSISYAAVEMAKRIFPDLTDKKAVLIGAGEMGELAALHLRQAGLGSLLILNRTEDKAKELAAKYQGQAQGMDYLHKALAEVDIVISSTSSDETILNLVDLQAVQDQRGQRPLFIIDIALPRDVDPEVNQLDSVYLYDIDDLKEIVEENRLVRQEEAQKAQLIIAEEAQNFQQWLDSLSLNPTIKALVKRGESLAQEELDRTLRKMGPVDEATKKAMENMAMALVRKLNHEPIAYLKGPAHGHDTELNRLRKIGTIQRVFQLNDEKPAE